MKILVTGAAGFIGSYVMQNLAQRGDEVVGLDNINDYYDVRLKYARLRNAGFFIPDDSMSNGEMLGSRKYRSCRFIRASIDDKTIIDRLFSEEEFDAVINLAAQAGVRYSIENPYAYLQSNLVGFLNILEACRHYNVKRLVYASSSSVYGTNDSVPFSEKDKVDSPVSLYAATKKSNELMAHAYSKLYGINTTGLRYFTVYGPWGRPDMSPMLFARAIERGDKIKVFNNGDMIRDFTYIDDIVAGTIGVLDALFKSPLDNQAKRGSAEQHCNSATSGTVGEARVYNIGCSNPVKLMDFISEIESAMGRTANKEMLPMQPGDVYQTNADTSLLEKEIGYKPAIGLHEGIKQFVDWFRSTPIARGL